MGTLQVGRPLISAATLCVLGLMVSGCVTTSTGVANGYRVTFVTNHELDNVQSVALAEKRGCRRIPIFGSHLRGKDLMIKGYRFACGGRLVYATGGSQQGFIGQISPAIAGAFIGAGMIGAKAPVNTNINQNANTNTALAVSHNVNIVKPIQINHNW